jgi:ATP-dependent exoDNAse (exonuclease V) alpha subunit
MASYHFSATPIKRSAGRSVVAAAAYRAAEKLIEQRTGETHDYTRKRGVEASVILAPEGAPAWVYDRQELWNQAEAVERQHNGQPAREIRLALPSELTDEQRAELVFNFSRDVFVKSGMIADISIHRPDRNGDQRNHHAHILLTMRELDGDKFAVTKQRAWNSKELLSDWREQWAEYQNRALEEAGHDARVDHRSYEERGIAKEPTTHLGPAANEMERRGEGSERGELNRETERRNREKEDQRRELAALDAAIEQEAERITSPARDPQDALERLQDDKRVHFEGIWAAERMEEARPDRMRWHERVLLFVARSARSMLDTIAEKARTLGRSRSKSQERRRRQEPTPHDRRESSRDKQRQRPHDRGIDR